VGFSAAALAGTAASSFASQGRDASRPPASLLPRGFGHRPTRCRRPAAKSFTPGSPLFCAPQGLGKTVTSLSLILKTLGTLPRPPPGVPLVWAQAADGRPVAFYRPAQAGGPAAASAGSGELGGPEAAAAASSGGGAAGAGGAGRALRRSGSLASVAGGGGGGSSGGYARAAALAMAPSLSRGSRSRGAGAAKASGATPPPDASSQPLRQQPGAEAGRGAIGRAATRAPPAAAAASRPPKPGRGGSRAPKPPPKPSWLRNDSSDSDFEVPGRAARLTSRTAAIQPPTKRPRRSSDGNSAGAIGAPGGGDGDGTGARRPRRATAAPPMAQKHEEERATAAAPANSSPGDGGSGLVRSPSGRMAAAKAAARIQDTLETRMVEGSSGSEAESSSSDAEDGVGAANSRGGRRGARAARRGRSRVRAAAQTAGGGRPRGVRGGGIKAEAEPNDKDMPDQEAAAAAEQQPRKRGRQAVDEPNSTPRDAAGVGRSVRALRRSSSSTSDGACARTREPQAAGGATRRATRALAAGGRVGPGQRADSGTEEASASDDESWEPGRVPAHGPKRGCGAGAGAAAGDEAPGSEAATAAVAAPAAAPGAALVKCVWVQCDACHKWRRMPEGYQLPDAGVGGAEGDDAPWHCWNDPRAGRAAAGCSAPQEPDDAAAAGLAYESCPGFARLGEGLGSDANAAHFSSLLAANAARRELWEDAGSLLWWLARLPPRALVAGAAVPREIAKLLPEDYGGAWGGGYSNGPFFGRIAIWARLRRGVRGTLLLLYWLARLQRERPLLLTNPSDCLCVEACLHQVPAH
jgi:hypothetical protein